MDRVMSEAAVELLLREPARVARWCGLERITDRVHGAWLREMIGGEGDFTLLAHRGSYKTTCLAFAMAAMLVLFPRRNIIFMRKTDDDVVEVVRVVKKVLKSEAMQCISRLIYGVPVEVVRGDMSSVHTGYCLGMRGAAALVGLGTSASLTGKHADIIVTDDIVNLSDRASGAERRRVCGVYQELQNIRNPGGRIINAGTPWHPEDAISLMPNVQRFDCWATGLLSADEIRKLQGAMSPSLFAANYELRHIASEGALFTVRPPVVSDDTVLRDGIAHLDAAYGGDDFTALTLGQIGADGALYLYGRLWRRHVDEVIDEVIGECDRLLCGPIYLETNGDKGYVARELRQRGAAVRPYAESMAKAVKIATWLRKWWPRVVIVEGTDRAWVEQVLGYGVGAEHDDAADSAASLVRAMGKRVGN